MAHLESTAPIDAGSKKQLIVYKLLNTINGKIYIGQTRRTLRNRLSSHVNRSKDRKASLVHYAIKKYGIEAFEASIIDHSAETLAELDAREIHWIKFYNCIAPNGYNLCAGGGGVKDASTETRERMRQAHLGQKRDAAAIAKSVAANSGKKRTEEFKRRLSLLKKGKGNGRMTIAKRNSYDARRGKPMLATSGEKHWTRSKPYPEDGRRKQSLAIIGRKRPDVGPRNTARTGWKHSEEAILKMRTKRNQVNHLGKRKARNAQVQLQPLPTGWLLRTTAVAKWLGLNDRHSVLWLINNWGLPIRRTSGGRLRYDPVDLEEWAKGMGYTFADAV